MRNTTLAQDATLAVATGPDPVMNTCARLTPAADSPFRPIQTLRSCSSWIFPHIETAGEIYELGLSMICSAAARLERERGRGAVCDGDCDGICDGDCDCDGERRRCAVRTRWRQPLCNFRNALT